MKTKDAGRALERLLAALEQELIEASDEEILEAAAELGMNPALKGSSAFFGLTDSRRRLLSSEYLEYEEGSDGVLSWPRGKGDLPPRE